jgi:hypothetical protein
MKFFYGLAMILKMCCVAVAVIVVAIGSAIIIEKLKLWFQMLFYCRRLNSGTVSMVVARHTPACSWE